METNKEYDRSEILPVRSETPSTTPVTMMMLAIEKNLDLDKVARAMELQQKWEANEARKAYHDAMAAFKANPPEIDKDRHVKFQTSKGMTEYRHASLANVTAKINAAMSLHGLSAGWKVSQADKQITVTCTITHRLGHSESTSLSAAPDESGSKNSIQAVGSTISYLERYTLLALAGLATHDQDDDGGQIETEYITADQVTHINDLINETKSNLRSFLNYMGVDSIEKILSQDYQKAVAPLIKKKETAFNAAVEKALKSKRQPGDE